jgi:hypothetical protein
MAAASAAARAAVARLAGASSAAASERELGGRERNGEKRCAKGTTFSRELESCRNITLDSGMPSSLGS